MTKHDIMFCQMTICTTVTRLVRYCRSHSV